MLCNELTGACVCPKSIFTAQIFRKGETKDRRYALVRHHVATGLGYTAPPERQGLRLPCLVNYTGYALDLAVLCGIPTGGVVKDRDLELGEVCGGVDGEIVGDGGEDEDGAEEEEGEDGEKGIEGAPFVHGGVGANPKIAPFHTLSARLQPGHYNYVTQLTSPAARTHTRRAAAVSATTPGSTHHSMLCLFPLDSPLPPPSPFDSIPVPSVTLLYLSCTLSAEIPLAEDCESLQALVLDRPGKLRIPQCSIPCKVVAEVHSVTCSPLLQAYSVGELHRPQLFQPAP